MRLQGRIVAATATTLMAAALVPAASGAATFNNTTPFTIDGLNEATPYFTDIAVAGLGGTVTDVNVTLNGYSHADGTNTGFLLQGPNGKSLVVLGGTGITQTVIGATTLTLDDQAAAVINAPPAPVTGSYKPTSYFPALDSYPAPGPLTNHGNAAPSGADTLASTFNGSTANGTWRLFVYDWADVGDTGSLAGGWSLQLSGDNNFTLGAAKVKKNGKSATLPGTFPGAGTAVVSDASIAQGSRALASKKKAKGRVVTKTVQIAGASTVDLPVKPTGLAKSILARKGKVRLSVKVTYTPTGGTAASQTVNVTLKKKKK